MENMKGNSSFQKFETKVGDHILHKADPEMFFFWVNYIFAKMQALFDKFCKLMRSYKSACQSVQAVQVIK